MRTKKRKPERFSKSREGEFEGAREFRNFNVKSKNQNWIFNCAKYIYYKIKIYLFPNIN